MMQIHQVLVTAAPGDAVTRMALHTRDLLRRAFSSDVFAVNVHEDLSTEVRPLRALPTSGRDRVIIYQSSIGHREVTRRLQRMKDPLLLVYHNITPGHFFRHWDSNLEDMVSWGRLELELLRPQVVRAVADSTFNASELCELGYDDVTVIPLGVKPKRLIRLGARQVGCLRWWHDRPVGQPALAPQADRTLARGGLHP